MAPGFGSGLAHALTQGLTGYNQGEEENRKQLILLAAQRRQEERQKQQDEIARIGALSQAAQAGLDVAPAVVPDTASRRAVQAENPTSPDGGESSPAIPSQDGTVLGSVGGMTVKVPQGGVVGKAARDDAAKQAQRTADLVRRAQPLNAKLPAGHPYKLSDDQVASIAADPQLYNEWAKGALGITKDPIATHKQAVGILRGIDAIDQRVDKGGVDARAAMASVSSQLLHALSGAAVSPSEYARLRQYVPTSSDSYEAAVTKLTRLKGEMERLHTGYSGAQAASPADPAQALKKKYGLE
jgi:hypothetical protein